MAKATLSYLVFLSTFLLVSKLHGQNDTIVVKKDPVIIHKDVYYSKVFDPHESSNHISLDYFISSKSGNTVQDDVFNQLEIGEVTAQKNVSLNYERKIKHVGFGFGLGLKKVNQQIDQSAFSKIGLDSMTVWRTDTIESYLSTKDGITEEIFVTEPVEFWEKGEVFLEKNANSSAKSYYLRIPISVSYTGYVNRWSISVKTHLVSNFLISKDEDVTFYDSKHQRQEFTDEYSTTYFVEFLPEIELGYTLDVGIGVFVGYRQNYLLSDMSSIISLNKRSKGSLGIGAKYFF